MILHIKRSTFLGDNMDTVQTKCESKGFFLPFHHATEMFAANLLLQILNWTLYVSVRQFEPCCCHHNGWSLINPRLLQWTFSNYAYRLVRISKEFPMSALSQYTHAAMEFMTNARHHCMECIKLWIFRWIYSYVFKFVTFSTYAVSYYCYSLPLFPCIVRCRRYSKNIFLINFFFCFIQHFPNCMCFSIVHWQNVRSNNSNILSKQNFHSHSILLHYLLRSYCKRLCTTHRYTFQSKQLRNGFINGYFNNIFK